MKSLPLPNLQRDEQREFNRPVNKRPERLVRSWSDVSGRLCSRIFPEQGTKIQKSGRGSERTHWWTGRRVVQ